MRDRWSGVDGYKRYQDLKFQEIRDAERLDRWSIEAKKRAEVEHRRRIQYEKIDHLRPQLANLLCLAGMPDFEANIRALDVVRQGKGLWMAREEQVENAHE